MHFSNLLFHFEHALAVLQPFIDSRREEDGESTPYRSLRAIVCNGRFIDVYERRSFSSVVNLARGATAHAYEDHTLPELCERIITVYERECTRLTPRHLDADPFQLFVGSESPLPAVERLISQQTRGNRVSCAPKTLFSSALKNPAAPTCKPAKQGLLASPGDLVFYFKSKLYGKWLKERGLTSKEQRKKDAFRDSLFDFILVPFIEAQGVTENL